MKKALLFLSLLWAATSQAQTAGRIPAWQVKVNTNGFDVIPVTQSNVQTVVDWIDDNLVTTNMLEGYLRGTNIVGATYSNEQWYIDTVVIPTNFVFVEDTNATYWTTEVVTNWNGSEESPEFTGSTAVIKFTHPDYVKQDGIEFPSFVSKEEFYGILNMLGFANYTPYTFYSEALYGRSNAPPANNASFLAVSEAYWTVPASSVVSTGQVIGVHLWGAGGYESVGGYTYGELVVVDPAVFTSSCPYHVTNGMQIIVHVGDGWGNNRNSNSVGRAAIWRAGTANYNSWTNELLVAGGSGGQGAETGYGIAYSMGGGTNGADGGTENDPYLGATATGGGGGTQTAGGSAGTPNAVGGSRVFGGAPRFVGSGYYYVVPGGDGYWGGGAGGNRDLVGVLGGGGGGSGYVAPNWNGETQPHGTNVLVAFTERASSVLSGPPKSGEVAYGLNAGFPGNPGRVSFEIRYDSWSR